MWAFANDADNPCEFCGESGTIFVFGLWVCPDCACRIFREGENESTGNSKA